MTSPFLDLPRFSLAATLQAGVKALYASYPRAMPDHPDYPPPPEDYRQLARRLRELARETQRPYTRRELAKLAGIYERRADYLDRRSV